ncbi:hypothetical protein BV25DRAFT_1578174 [Artomyces pyxidatus]|uniref:Uncharacterized protein n=1 Tax=Artomyces pyxidatus TaxID=48021 RepID=A0ACB8SIU7_9AGAM|nr:hypothetical protein BV25DRAFT_1578174 [Artomyces pyxidatus]
MRTVHKCVLHEEMSAGEDRSEKWVLTDLHLWTAPLDRLSTTFTLPFCTVQYGRPGRHGCDTPLRWARPRSFDRVCLCARAQLDMFVSCGLHVYMQPTLLFVRRFQSGQQRSAKTFPSHGWLSEDEPEWPENGCSWKLLSGLAPLPAADGCTASHRPACASLRERQRMTMLGGTSADGAS